MSDKHTGSCLCKEMKYEVIGEAKRFLFCQCSRCRKSTSSAHASNLFIDAKKIDWVSGEANLRMYKVPDAERFVRHFCVNCGSSMPIFVDARNMVVIPAGTLDSHLDFKPEARIFNDSRAGWTHHEELACFPEYPE